MFEERVSGAPAPTVAGGVVSPGAGGARLAAVPDASPGASDAGPVSVAEVEGFLPPHTVTWATPTGHLYHSTAPPPPGAGRPKRNRPMSND